MYRSNTCGELRISDVSKQVVLCGWVKTIRKFGSIIFIDLRDRYGITQLYFNEEATQKYEGENLSREYVLQAKGIVRERSNKNPDLATGDIEIEVDSIEILNKSDVPPFTIEENTDGGDELRMKYRYLDLRREPLKRNIELRYQVSRATRNFLHSMQFLEIETPMLIKSTPEGARDFVVPSRMHTGQYYALPQSPQLFKQLLMVAGYDKYFQIVKCFRDEDLRADRQPEFTQIDCEMSFVEQEDVLNVFEEMTKYIFKEVKNIYFEKPFPRMSYHDAMNLYGNDKPDIRFDMTLKNITPLVGVHGSIAHEMTVFKDAQTTLAICVPQGSTFTRKQTDELTEWVKRPQIGMKGMAYIKVNTDGTYKSSFDKYFNAEQLKLVADTCKANPGDIILILSGNEQLTRKAMSELRLEMGNRLGLRKSDEFAPLWVTGFPLLEYDAEQNKYNAMHHPFTSPIPEHLDWLKQNIHLEKIIANAYDLVLNGTEIGGGSIRIFDKEVQSSMFKALGFSKEDAEEKFGFLLSAFQYGTPPHGGIALGFDRLCALLGGSDSIRDFIAFPKNNAGRDMMLDAPSLIDENQKKELYK